VLLISICSHELVHDLAPNRKSIVLLIEMHSASLMLQAVRGPFWPVGLTVGLLVPRSAMHRAHLHADGCTSWLTATLLK
jgi:hypothetical protein